MAPKFNSYFSGTNNILVDYTYMKLFDYILTMNRLRGLKLLVVGPEMKFSY